MKSVLIGAAFAIGGADTGSRAGPMTYHRSRLRFRKDARDGGLVWQCRAQPLPWPENAQEIRASCRRLARRVARMRHRAQPVIIGGDHSCAIGTWTGLSAFGRRPLGLLWIDAHLDSHTPLSSPSGRVHGMPLAVLLGEGVSAMSLLTQPVILARHSVVFGVRSYEAGEPERLERLGVRYYTMREIRSRGLAVCFREAWRRVASAPGGFGVSLDLDALDPRDAPAVSVPEPGGLPLRPLLAAIGRQSRQGLRGVEVVEYNPLLDRDKRTVKALTRLLDVLLTS